MRVKGKGKNPNSIKALKEHGFEKGKSGNPAGRPKGIPSLRDRLARFMEMQVKAQSPDGTIQKMTLADEIVCAMLAKSKDGDMMAIKETFDRYYGKEAQTMNIKQQEETIVTIEERIQKHVKSD